MKYKRFAIIDDDEIDRLTYKKLINSTYLDHSEVLEFATGEEALQFLEKFKVDFIFLDYRLTDINGISLLKKIRNITNKQVPIVMMTGQGSESIAATAIKKGAFDYIVKGETSPLRVVKIMEEGLAEAHNKYQKHLKKQSFQAHAHYDQVTGLINKISFEKLAGFFLEDAKKSNKPLAILLIEVKNQNLQQPIDWYELATEIATVIPKKSILARYSDTSFGLLCSGVHIHSQLLTISEQIVSKIQTLNQGKYKSAVGIACFPDSTIVFLFNRFSLFSDKHSILNEVVNKENIDELISLYSARMYDEEFVKESQDAKQLIDKASSALQNSFQQNKTVCFFEDVEKSANFRAIQTELILHEAIQDPSIFQLLYQPFFLMQGEQPYGMVVSPSLIHDTLGTLMYADFYESAFKLKVNSFVEVQALINFLNDINHFSNYDFIRTIILPVNIASEVLNDKDFITCLSNLKQHTKFNYVLSINDKILNDLIINDQSELIALGMDFQIILQHFNLDHSYWEKLTKLPIKFIRLSSALTSTMLTDKRTALTVKSIIFLGKNFNIDVIAEGVNNIEHYHYLLEAGSKFGQGEFFIPPMTGNQLQQYVARLKEYL